jgi:hypothetical protein
MTKWIEALESGEYPQDALGGYLKTERGFCCLGVLEEIAGAKWVKDNDRFETRDGYYAMPAPHRLQTFLGTNEGDTVLVYDPEMGIDRGVHSVNDSGKSFAHIAGLLRAEFGIPKAE